MVMATRSNTMAQDSSASSSSYFRITPFRIRLIFGMLAITYFVLVLQIKNQSTQDSATKYGRDHDTRRHHLPLPSTREDAAAIVATFEKPIFKIQKKHQESEEGKVDDGEKKQQVVPLSSSGKKQPANMTSTGATTFNKNNHVKTKSGRNPFSSSNNIMHQQSQVEFYKLTKGEKQHIEDPIQLHKQLESFYDNFSSPTNPSLLWVDNITKLPKWMTSYLNWHHHSRRRLIDNPESYGEYRYFVMQCIKGQDYHCGGLSDRLKPLPWAIRIAYYTRRLLFIHWTRPAPLTDFLAVPKNGFDWRLPPWLGNQLETDRNLGVQSLVEKEIRAYARTNITMVRSRFQSFHAGLYWYDDQIVAESGEHKAAELFHELWKLTFTPSIAVRTLIESEMNLLDLKPGQYTAAHLRALYGMKDRAEAVKANWAENALNCASELRPQNPIFFASDSTNATHYAKIYANRRNATVKTRNPNPNPPYHIDKVKNHIKYPPSDFYDTFVDLYIMAQADCVTYNKGGYGIFALLMSRNSSCGVRQDALDRPKILHPCIWVDNVANGTNTTRDHYIPYQEEIPLINHDPIYYLECVA